MSVSDAWYVVDNTPTTILSQNPEAKGKDDNVRVAIRCRPLNETEIKNGNKEVVQMDQVSGQVIVQSTKAHGEKEKVFTFDTVFDSEAKQVDVYNETARPIIKFALEGYNGMTVV